MSIDLIEFARKAITPEVVEHLSRALGEPLSATQKALEGGVPAILAGMAGKTSTGEDIAALLLLFTPRGGDGEGMVQKVLGDNATVVADAIGSQSGVRPASALRLLGTAAPLALGAIRTASGPGGVTVSSLLSILSSQRESIVRGLPAGLGVVLGGAALAPVGMVKEVAAGPDQRKSYWPAWVILAVLLLGLTVGGLISSFKQETTPVQAADTGEMAPDAGTAVPLADSSPATFQRKTLPNGTELNIPQMGIENRLIDFIESPHAVDKETWFDFDRLLFETGSARLEPSSQEQLDNIAAILKAYPKVTVRIGGYTDDVGSRAANLALSTERARKVMASLVKAGVAESRVTAQGYGEIHAVADNATEEGRAKNRRISLRVTAK